MREGWTHTQTVGYTCNSPFLFVSRSGFRHVGLRQVQTQLADCTGLSAGPLHKQVKIHCTEYSKATVRQSIVSYSLVNIANLPGATG